MGVDCLLGFDFVCSPACVVNHCSVTHMCAKHTSQQYSHTHTHTHTQAHTHTHPVAHKQEEVLGEKQAEQESIQAKMDECMAKKAEFVKLKKVCAP